MARKLGKQRKWKIAFLVVLGLIPTSVLAEKAITKTITGEFGATATLYINGESAWLITKETDKDLATLRQYVGPNDTENLANAAGGLCIYRKQIPAAVTQVSFAAIFPDSANAVVVSGDQNLPVMLCSAKPDEAKRIESGLTKIVPVKQLPVQPK